MNADYIALIRAGDLVALKWLVASGQVSVNGQRDRTSLHLAAALGRLEMVRYLVEEAGADLRVRDDKGSTFLDLAANNGRLEIVRYLIEERGMDPTATSPLVSLKDHCV